MRNTHNKFEDHKRNSQEYELVETLERKATRLSKIPPRTSAHPSALAAVQPKYTRHLTDPQRITPFDGITSNPIELAELTQRATDDLGAEDIFTSIDNIDELDTFPQGTQSQQASDESLVSQLDTVPTPAVQGQQRAAYGPLITRPLGELSLDMARMGQPQGFSLERWVDNVRWWLLFPGRLEFLLWFVGAIVLVCLTSFFLMVMMAVWMR